MDLLRYTSDEMFSSTDLIRKSKKIFDKINKKEINKAVILRDGKPSFMLLDFNSYEELIKDYLSLKEINSIKEKKNKGKINLSKKELNTALEEIDKIDFNKKAPLKDFWEDEN